MTMTTDTRPRTAVQLQTNGMGDLVWHAEYFRCIAEQSQGGQVTVIAAPTTMARDLIGHEPWLREVIDFDRRPRNGRRGRHSGLDGLMRMGAELAPKRLDRMVMFSDHPGRAVIVCWRAGIRTKLGYGATWLQRLLLTKAPRIAMYDGPPVTGTYLDATAFAIAQGFCSAPLVPHINVRPDALARMRERLAAWSQPGFALSIGSSEPFKQWGAENFAELAARLARTGAGVLLVGGPSETALAQAITAGIASELRPQVLSLTDAPVADTVAAMSLMRACIGNDTGATNIAAAVGTPAWVLMGARPPLMHDPSRMKMLEGASLADISPAAVEAQVLAGLA
ncbi:glycosyltransferase family 9 protein [Paucibacter sp. R3-3]|uniref:Glycosyltransferase family 9 protein n=2 Tax=Roseateles agri TaxID=3098619 RepID=A0ABU5DGU5_9BURK|nr:glycosyltransferase family 9 protein [Paucibacter sp. R3-3]